MGYAAEYLTRGAFAPRIARASRLGQRLQGICDSHGLFDAHVYAHIIPYLVTSGLPRAGADQAASWFYLTIIYLLTSGTQVEVTGSGGQW